MASDPLDLIRCLLEWQTKLGLHAFLCIPQAEAEQLQQLRDLLNDGETTHLMNISRVLAQSRPGLAKSLVAEMEIPLAKSVAAPELRLSPRQEAIRLLNTLPGSIEQGVVLNSSQHPRQALEVYQQALQIAHQFEAYLEGERAQAYQQLARLAMTNKQGLLTDDEMQQHNMEQELVSAALQTWEQALQLDPEQADIAADYAWCLIDQGRLQDALLTLEKLPEEPTPDDWSSHRSIHYWAAKARLAAELGDSDRALTCLTKTATCLAAVDIQPEKLSRLAEIALEQDYLPLAELIAENIVTRQPQHLEGLRQLALAQLAQEKAIPAVSHALLAFELKPDQTHHCLLIEALEASGEWTTALEARSSMVNALPQPSTQEYYLLASCALQAGQVERALAACQKALEIDPEDGLAVTMLGEIALAEQKTDQALEYFIEAVQRSPGLGETWLNLARWYRRQDQSSRALDTLQQASRAAAGFPQVQLALGEAYLGENSPSLALQPLRLAAELAAQSHPGSVAYPKERKLNQSITFALASTLRQLGHLAESRQAFERICKGAPGQSMLEANIAHGYAQTLLAMGDTSAALPWLVFAIHNSPNPLARLDFARALLNSQPGKSQATQAVEALQEVVKDPAGLSMAQRAEAFALLAEASQLTGDLANGMQAYRQALEISHADQETWHFRLSFGLGKIALAMGQFETAIAALSEAHQLEATDPEVARCLSEAYTAINLPGDAFLAARSAIAHSPTDLPTVFWFVKQCQRVGELPGGDAAAALDASIQAVHQALEVHPERADLVVRLSELQLKHGSRDAALNTLDLLNAETEVDLALNSEDLIGAARLVSQMGEPQKAAQFLEQAISLHEIEHADAPPNEKAGYYYLLAHAYHEMGDFQAGCQSIEQAIRLNPDLLDNYYTKTSLLLDMSEITRAIACLEEAQWRWPESGEIPLRLGLVKYSQGELQAASDLLEIAWGKLSRESSLAQEASLACWLGAEISHALLADTRALELLHASVDEISLDESAYLKAELALQSGFQEDAAENATIALAPILERAARHPRLLAVQSRLLARQEGINETSLGLFESTLEALMQPAEFAGGNFGTSFTQLDQHYYRKVLECVALSACLQSLAEAALELNQWEAAEILVKQLEENLPATPLKHLLHARWLVLMAERQHLCQALLVVQHAPRGRALDEAANQEFEKSLLAAADQIDLSQDRVVQEITHWRVRGKAIFSPGDENLEAFQQYAQTVKLTVADQASLIWLFSQLDRQAEIYQLADELPVHPLTATALALALKSENDDRALFLTRQAIERMAGPDLLLPDALPMLLSLSAIIASASVERRGQALEDIQAALAIWPDEARWHDLAASLLLTQPQHLSETAVDPILAHLLDAARLEPTLAEYHLKLAAYYTDCGEVEQALAAAETATGVQPELPQTWLVLAQLQKETGQIEAAITSVEQSLSFENQSLEALLLRAELALLNNNPRGAFSRAQTIVNITPEQPQAWFIIAQALAELDQPEDALQAIDQAIDYSSDPSPLQELRIRLLYRLYGTQTAIQAIQALMATAPGDPFLNALLADYHLEAGGHAQSLLAARAALQSGGDVLPARTQGHLHHLIGSQMRQVGQLDQAVYHLNEAIRKSPQQIDPYLELGRTHQDRRQLSQALEIYQMAGWIAPNDPRPYYLAGLAFKDSKDYIQAETMFRRAAHLAPKEVSIHRQLAAVVALNLVHNRRVAITD
jgi:tetratricopeptide (TPR) repeat protein